MTNPTAPPKHLSAEARKLWRSVLADDELEKRHEAMLCTALEALDRMRQAHPAVVIDRESRTRCSCAPCANSVWTSSGRPRNAPNRRTGAQHTRTANDELAHGAAERVALGRQAGPRTYPL